MSFSLPTMRRHMIAAFIGSKLLLMGGVGRYRLKLSSIDIYDVHTGEDFNKITA